MSKDHSNCVKFHKQQLEEKYNYRCKKEFDLSRNGAIHHLDLSCFNKQKPPVAIEVETGKSWTNPQIQSNAEDLKEFKRLYPTSKTFHIKASDRIDFNKELGQTQRFVG